MALTLGRRLILFNYRGCDCRLAKAREQAAQKEAQRTTRERQRAEEVAAEKQRREAAAARQRAAFEAEEARSVAQLRERTEAAQRERKAQERLLQQQREQARRWGLAVHGSAVQMPTWFATPPSAWNTLHTNVLVLGYRIQNRCRLTGTCTEQVLSSVFHLRQPTERRPSGSGSAMQSRRQRWQRMSEGRPRRAPPRKQSAVLWPNWPARTRCAWRALPALPHRHR